MKFNLDSIFNKKEKTLPSSNKFLTGITALTMFLSSQNIEAQNTYSLEDSKKDNQKSYEEYTKKFGGMGSVIEKKLENGRATFEITEQFAHAYFEGAVDTIKNQDGTNLLQGNVANFFDFNKDGQVDKLEVTIIQKKLDDSKDVVAKNFYNHPVEFYDAVLSKDFQVTEKDEESVSAIKEAQVNYSMLAPYLVEYAEIPSVDLK